MPTAVLVVLHVVDESHPEAVCAAALSHVSAAATAQLPIKLVVLHNRPSHFEKPLRALIASHISNVVFCTYTGLLCGQAARALFGYPAADPPPGGGGADPLLGGASRAGSRLGDPSALLPDHSKSTRLAGAGTSGFVGGPGLDSSGWGISQRQLADGEALQCLLGQVAVGCARSSLCTAVCVARATTVVSYEDLWSAFMHFRKVPGAGGTGVMLQWLRLLARSGGVLGGPAGVSQNVLVRSEQLLATPSRRLRSVA